MNANDRLYFAVTAMGNPDAHKREPPASWHLSLGPTREQEAFARGQRVAMRRAMAALLQLAEDTAREESAILSISEPEFADSTFAAFSKRCRPQSHPAARVNPGEICRVACGIA